jgi:hypothetical protein
MKMMLVRRAALACGIAVLPSAGLAQVAAQPRAQALPSRLTDQEFWKFINDISEPGGFFRSENLLSNETGYQMVIPALLSGARANRIYLGVGPEQNFTYIAALKPKMAIIFDIRRGNLLEHLLYKALFELSSNRAEFIEKLFSKTHVSGLDTNSSAEAIAAAYWDVYGDSAIYKKNRDAVREVLSKKHGFPLNENDWIDLFWVYDQFYYNGLPITYTSSSGGNPGRSNMPTYRTLMEANDGNGLNRGFLGTEANWRYLKDLHSKNLIVPVVGNFGGPKAIKAVGAWLKERGATVGAFYASNVEQYLFQDGLAYNYYNNVAELPIDSASVFIRSGNSGGMGRMNGRGGMSAPNRMCSIQRLLEANKAGRIGSYGEIFFYCEY